MSTTTLALLARPGTPQVGRRLVRSLAERVDLHAATWFLTNRTRPSALVLTTPGLVASIPPAWRHLPRAVLGDGRPGARPVEVSRAGTDAAGPRVTVATVRLADPGVVAEDWAAVAPLVRRRRRARAGLPDHLVPVIGDLPDAEHGSWTDDETAVVLGLASAAVVVGPWLEVALAQATPVVTSTAEAARIGAREGRDVLVVTADAVAWTATARAEADALARHEARAAALARRARALAVAELDVGGAAATILDSLGPVDAPGTVRSATERVTDALSELGAPAGTLVRARALRLVADLDGDRCETPDRQEHQPCP